MATGMASVPATSHIKPPPPKPIATSPVKLSKQPLILPKPSAKIEKRLAPADRRQTLVNIESKDGVHFVVVSEKAQLVGVGNSSSPLGSQHNPIHILQVCSVQAFLRILSHVFAHRP